MISPKRREKKSTEDMASKKYIKNKHLYIKKGISFFKIITEMEVLMQLYFHGTAQDLTSNLHTKSGRELRALS